MIVDDNEISVFPSLTDESCPVLNTLSLRGNRLVTVNLPKFAPHVKYLHLDANYLITLLDLKTLQSIELLSLRSQNMSPDAETSPFDTIPDVPTLDLAGNRLPTLAITQPLINLQNLNLSSSGLHSLPPDFGAQLPSLRTLNLNYNGLKDLRPLLNIHHLRSLSAVGNRLSRLRKNVAVLRLLPDLETVDLRGNPFTVGFHNPGCMREVALRSDTSTNAAENEGGLLMQDRDVDREYVERLDEDTRLRKRVYEMLIASACKKVVVLDGLRLDKKVVLAKDGVWKRLVELGVVRKCEG